MSFDNNQTLVKDRPIDGASADDRERAVDFAPETSEPRNRAETQPVPPQAKPGNVPAKTEPAAPPALSGDVIAPKRSRKRAILAAVALIAAGAGGYYGYHYYTVGQFLVSTDDAYVGANMSVLAAKVPGYVASVAVADNAAVKAGDLLMRIDDGDYKLAVDAARRKVETQDATIERIARQFDAQKAQITQANAQIQASKAALTRTQADFERTQNLAASSYATAKSLDQARQDRDTAQANLTSAQAALTAAQANLDVLGAQKLEAQRAKAELQNALEKSQRDLSFTEIRAPFDGTVGNRAAEVGQYVQPGTRLMALVPLDKVYVDANFKETQLAGIKAGQKVDIEVDAHSKRQIEGVVESVSPASGSQFSLLPPENATGNFTKIVQRVPVRISIPAKIAREGFLRPGLSVVATVHTRDPKEPAPTLMGLIGLGGSSAVAQNR